MPRDEIQKNKPLKAAKPDAGGANIVTVPLLGIVKDNIDPNRSGRIFVYISDNSGSDPDDRSNWVQVSYLTPFFGRTTPSGGKDNLGTYKSNPSSYGCWNSPPDVGTTVICMFINGDMNYGFYIGSVPDPDALQMIPAIGATDNVIPNSGEAESYGGAIRLPVTNINSNNKNVSDGPGFVDAPKPIHTYTAAIMFKQGILRDPLRGPISSSAQREAASRVGWGVSTPGRPIYEGGYDDASIASNLENKNNAGLKVVARRGGHSIVMDDGDIIGRDQLVRIRTALGHQITMSDDGQTLFILHSNGQTYIELGKEGTVDVYATNSVNIRTQGDLNLHADNNININAAKNLNIKAENIQIDADKEFKKKIGSDYKISTAGVMTFKTEGAMSLQSAGDASFASQAAAYVNGTKINLNTGKTGTIPQDVKELTKTMHTDTLFDATKGFLAAPGKLESIVSRAPAHCPWSDAGLGVDVKVDVNSSSQLPSSPKENVAATNQAAAVQIENPVTPAQVAKQAASKAVSKSIDKPTTNAILAQMENQVKAGPAAQAVAKGATIVTNPETNTKEAAVGLYGLSPKQLETSGFIKPGSASMVQAQVTAGKTLGESFPDNIWTGKSGIQNLAQFRENKSAQADAAVDLLQQSQTALVQANIIKGTEAPPQIAGLVMSGATSGVDKTIDTVKQIGSGLFTIGKVVGTAKLQQLTEENAGKILGKASPIIQNIAGGNFAAGIAQTATKGLGSIAQALTSGKGSAVFNSPFSSKIDPSIALRGIAGAAFQEIAQKMPRLKAGIPQNLGVILKQSIERELSSASSTSGASNDGLLGTLGNIANTVKDKLPGVIGAEVSREVFKALPGAGNQIGQALSKKIGAAGADITKNLLDDPGNIVSQFGNLSTYQNALKIAGGGLSDAAVQIAKNSAASASASFASGLRNIPGGTKIVSALVDKAAAGAGALFPGKDKVSSLIRDASTSALSGVKAQVGRIRDPLDRLASVGLSKAAAAQLQAGIASVSSAVASSFKLPTVAVNTLDTAEINKNFDSLLNDPGIPKPLTDAPVSEEAKSAVETAAKQREQAVSDINSVFEKEQTSGIALRALNRAKNSLPPGDPKITELEADYQAKYKAYRDALAEYNKINP